MNRSISRVLFLAILSMGTACSFAPEAPAPADIPLTTVDLYYNRASMDRVSFEQFKLSGNTLFVECGSVSGGRHSPAEQKVIAVDDENLGKIKQLAWAINRYVEELHAEFKEPGGISNFFDSGRLNLKLGFATGGSELTTSFDGIALGSADKEITVGNLARTLRKIAGPRLCGAIDFYDLNAQKLRL